MFGSTRNTDKGLEGRASPAGRLLFEHRLYDWILLAVLAAAAIEFAALRFHYGFEDRDANFARLIAGTAPTPFQYRILIPMLARAAIALGALTHLSIPASALFAASDMVFYFGSFLAALATLKALKLSRPEILAALLGLAMILNTDYFGTEILNLRNIYDVPAVFFAFVATYLLLRGKLGWFYILLPIAILNRETAVFLSLLFVATQWRRMPLPRLAAHAAAQGLLILAIKLTVMAAFRHNPGVGAVSFYIDDFTASGPGAHRLHDLRLMENLRLFITPRRLVHMSAIFGFLWIPYLFALRGLRQPFFRAAAWIIPPFLGLMLVVGNIDEFRIYSELVPPLFFTVALGWARWNRRDAPSSILEQPIARTT